MVPEGSAKAMQEQISRLAPGQVTLVEVDGQPVAVANVGGQLFAFDDLCTHRQCSLSDGRLEGNVIACGCHSSRFDVSTGEVLEGPARRPLTTYSLDLVTAGMQVSPAPPPPASEERAAPDPVEAERVLAHVDLFAGFDEAALHTLQELTFRRSFEAGEVIVQEGRTGNGLYVVLSGRVEVVRGLPDRPYVITTFGPGDPFGELALLGDWKRTATVQALEPTMCLGIDRWVFLAYLRREPRLAGTMMQLLANRLAETDPELAIEALQEVARRIVQADQRLS